MAGHTTWTRIKEKRKLDGTWNQARVDEGVKRLKAETRAYRLAEVRNTHMVNQSELAERIGVSQSRVSRIERGELDHTEIATIRDYVEALGGELEVLAKFGDERIIIG
jgi:DNA-binding XRE family transcriptional regulator